MENRKKRLEEEVVGKGQRQWGGGEERTGKCWETSPYFFFLLIWKSLEKVFSFKKFRVNCLKGRDLYCFSFEVLQMPIKMIFPSVLFGFITLFQWCTHIH